MIRALVVAGALSVVAPAMAISADPALVPNERWTLDQLSFSIREDAAEQKRIMDAIGPDKTLRTAERTLARLGVKTRRDTIQLDPSRLPETLRASVLATISGEPMAVAVDKVMTIDVLVARERPDTLPASIEPARLDAARALVAVLSPEDERNEAFTTTLDAILRAQITGMLRAQPQLAAEIDRNPEIGEILTRFLERQRSLILAELRETSPQMLNAQAQSLARRFTTDELRQLTAIFSQPLGRKYLHESVKIGTDQEMTAWQRQMDARVQARLQPELQRLQEEMRAAAQAHGRKPSAS